MAINRIQHMKKLSERIIFYYFLGVNKKSSKQQPQTKKAFDSNTGKADCKECRCKIFWR